MKCIYFYVVYPVAFYRCIILNCLPNHIIHFIKPICLLRMCSDNKKRRDILLFFTFIENIINNNIKSKLYLFIYLFIYLCQLSN